MLLLTSYGVTGYGKSAQGPRRRSYQLVHSYSFQSYIDKNRR